jgi:arginine/lysine/ornithine decarboxylase
MGTLQIVLFLISLGVSWSEIRALVNALAKMKGDRSISTRIPVISHPNLPKQVLTPRDAFFAASKRSLPVMEAIGCVAGETISAYPPGSAVVVAGEVITSEVIAFLQAIKIQGGVLKGASDKNFDTINIIEP